MKNMLKYHVQHLHIAVTVAVVMRFSRITICVKHLRVIHVHMSTLRSPGLHVPTRRISLEQVVWYLIKEHDIEVREHMKITWHRLLWESEVKFRNIQKRRCWPYDLPFPPPVN